MSAPPSGFIQQLLRITRAPAETKLAPLAGACIGAISGFVYWLSMQLWPASVAVALSLAVSALLAAPLPGVNVQIFYLLIKYATLMTLTAASLPFAAPPNTALPWMIVCAYAASRALRVAEARISHVDLGIALLIGFLPAVLLGIPGLVGLAAAVLISITLARLRPQPELAPLLTEIGFYLAASAARSLV